MSLNLPIPKKCHKRAQPTLAALPRLNDCVPGLEAGEFQGVNIRDFDQVVSLGNTCQTAYQIRRFFGDDKCPSCIFDYRVTPNRTVLAYIERDFRGFFERADLERRASFVINPKFGTQHQHEFPTGIEEDYRNARSRHDHLCDKFRQIILGNVPTLFVVQSGRPARFIRSATALIERKNPNLIFRILSVMRIETGDWRGYDAFWDEAFNSAQLDPPSAWAAMYETASRKWRRLNIHRNGAGS